MTAELFTVLALLLIFSSLAVNTLYDLYNLYKKS